MKKILLLIPALDAGGAERVMATLANEWSKKYNIDLLIFQNTDSFYELDQKVNLVKMNLPLPKRGLCRLLSIPIVEIKRYRYILNIVRSNHYEFVLSFTNTTNVMACLVAKKNKEQFVAISERCDPNKRPFITQSILNKLYKKCHLVICQNEAVKNYFKSKDFKNHLVVLPNPVNFADIPNEKPKQREHIISTVGRLTEQKNHAVLIDAFSDVRKKYPNYKLQIYGIGPLENSLKSQIANLGLENYAKLMGTKKKVMHEINKTEIFVLPSNYEGFPNVLIEAMATQMPVISSDFATGVARELIENGKNGYLFKVGDKDGLTTSITKMLSRSNEYDEIGKTNRKIANHYKDRIVAKRWLNAITESKIIPTRIRQ